MNSRLRIAGIFQLITGAGIIGIWTVNLLTGSIPELHAEPVRIFMHLLAEAATGISLLVSGCLILIKRKKCNELFHLSFGALIYTLIVSPGYFIQMGQWGTGALFLVLLVTSLAVLAAQIAEDRL